uniref:Eukaryotic translation initiation factor 3, subunit D n=1 Tax=Sinocyclocheilus grahami TaxID=75366 RepID=A0A672K668_SINGR
MKCFPLTYTILVILPTPSFSIAFQYQLGTKLCAQLKPRDSSVEVRSDWEVKEEMDFPRLMKMRYMDVADPLDIECCGALEHYDKAFDRVTTRNEKQLKSIKRIFHTVTTTDDPVIRKLAKTQGNVFCCLNSLRMVGKELYMYRRWKLGEDIDLIVRCEHDGVMTGANGEVSFVNVKTLNEWDSRHCNGVDWRQKLDSQRGAVLATELKNNSYKLARWTCCAILAGSEYLKLGYVSRYHVKDSSRHVVLGTQQFKPNEFASQINLSMENAWGILRCEGKYLILKDPNKARRKLCWVSSLRIEIFDVLQQNEDN